MPLDLSPALILIGAAVLVAVALLAWAFRSPSATDNPWAPVAIFVAFLILAAAMWPLLPLLLVLAIPAVLVAVLIYVFMRRRPAL